MIKHSPLMTLIYFALIMVLVVGLSIVSNHLWGGKSEQATEHEDFIIEKEMTVDQFGKTNGIPNQVLKEIFDIETKSDLEKQLTEYGTPDQIAAMAGKKMALASERAGKNWIKIPVKFGLWFAFLSAVFITSKQSKITSRLRKWLLFGAVIIFGIAMGSDPSPMGTVKDAVLLFGIARAVFIPRMIAMGVLFAIVILANKYVCAWGCQAGVLQDLIFRINQTDQRKAVIGRQFKLPFVLTNSIRIAFFCLFVLVVLLWGIDVIEPVDPFKIYKPVSLGLAGGLFVGALLMASIFLYRPWCHLFCPFGLAGWLLEKMSIIKISVDYETCIACGRCETACPSTVMAAILKRDTKTIPDCFACYTCREVCPTNSIAFSSRRRRLPPPGHFDKKGHAPTPIG